MRKKFVLSILIVFILTGIFTSTASADPVSGFMDKIKEMVEEYENSVVPEIVEFHEERSDWLVFAGLGKIIFHDIGWMLVKMLFNLTSFVESLIPEALTMLDFLEYAGIDSLAAAIINDLVVALMILTLVFLGYKTIIAKNPPNFKSVGVNIMMSSLLILGMPTLLSYLQDLSTDFYEATQTNGNNNDVTSLAWTIVQTNSADVMYASDHGFDPLLNDYSGERNKLTPTILKHADMSEIIKPETIDNLYEDNEQFSYLRYRITGGTDGSMTVVPVDNGGFMSWFTEMFDAGYLRYPANFFPMFVGMISLTIAYIFTLFVFITTIIEIGFKRIIGLFVFATDLESGERTKMVVKDILNAFLLIAFTGISFYMYTLFISYLSTTDVNWLVGAIAHVSATVILIKGSSTILKYFGVDVGLKEGAGQIMATGAAAFGIARGVQGIKSIGKNMKEGMKKIGGGNDSGDDPDGGDDSDDDGNTPNGVGGSGNRKMNSINDRSEGNQKTGIPKLKNKELAAKENGSDLKSINSSEENGNSSGTNKDVKANQLDDNDNKVNGKQKEPQTLGSNDKGEKLSSVDGGAPSINHDSEKQVPRATNLNAESNKNNTGNSVRDNLKNDGSQSINNSNSSNTVPRYGDNSNHSHASQSGNSQRNPKDSNNISGGDVSSEGIQRIKQQIEKQPYSDLSASKQRIIQEVEKGNFGSPESKQRILQEVQNTSNATPSQLKQNIEQVITGNGIPNETKASVQRVVKEFENKNMVPESTRQRVIQEVERANFGGNNTVKQNVVQQLDKAFNANPEQLQQNIRQVVDKVENTTSNAQINQSHNLSSNQAVNVKSSLKNEYQPSKQESSYFGNAFNNEAGRSSRPSRFEKINFKSKGE